MSQKPGFFRELQRRNVLRAVVLYVGAVWALAQGVSQLTPALGLPDWATRAFLIACVAGFPFWLAFAWFYEFTPHGFKRDSEVAVDAPLRRSNAHKLDFAIIGVLAAAVVLLGSGYFLRVNAPTPQASLFNPPADSIAVLPFANLSDDPKQAYFSNGITEELTGALGQSTGLTVIAWETASKYANGRETPEQIGKALNVAQILDGSIQREGDAVRVSVELVSTISGRQLWSAHYDDSFQNIFAVQDKISAEVADALKVKFAGMRTVPTLNPEAHEFYLKGLVALGRDTAADVQAAQQHFRQALKLDPNYADAWAMLAGTYGSLVDVSTLPREEAVPEIRAAAEKALALDPRNVNALVELGNADLDDNRITRAKAKYEQALALDPSNARAHLDYGLVLPLEQALVEEREAARLDPDNAVVQNNIATTYQDLAEWPQMAAAEKTLNRLSPHDIDAAFDLAFAYTQMRRGEAAAKAFDLIQPATAIDRQLVDIGRLTYQARLKPALRSRALAALDELHRTNLSPDSQGDLIQLYLALGEKETAVQILTGVCAAAPVVCSNLAVYPVYAPLRGDPRFEKLSSQYTAFTPGSAPASASSR